MIGWYVPLSVYPAGYGENPKVPLPLVALASQKSGLVLHFLCFYAITFINSRSLATSSKKSRNIIFRITSGSTETCPFFP